MRPEVADGFADGAGLAGGSGTLISTLTYATGGRVASFTGAGCGSFATGGALAK